MLKSVICFFIRGMKFNGAKVPDEGAVFFPHIGNL